MKERRNEFDDRYQCCTSNIHKIKNLRSLKSAVDLHSAVDPTVKIFKRLTITVEFADRRHFRVSDSRSTADFLWISPTGTKGSDSESGKSVTRYVIELLTKRVPKARVLPAVL